MWAALRLTVFLLKLLQAFTAQFKNIIKWLVLNRKYLLRTHIFEISEKKIYNGICDKAVNTCRKFRCTKFNVRNSKCFKCSDVVQWVCAAILQVTSLLSQSLALHKDKTELLIGFLCFRCGNWALMSLWSFAVVSLDLHGSTGTLLLRLIVL